MAIDELLDEHEQSERVLQWLRNNGAGLIGGIALGLAAIGGWKWWDQRHEQARMGMATQYQAAIDAIDAKDWRTKAAQEQRDASYAAGRVPLLARHWADVQAMVACARAQLADHADGGEAMFTNGVPEQTIVWRDDDVWCRARLDWLRPGAIDDYKTAESANPEDWTRSMFRFGADIQVAWYLRGVAAVTGEDVTFRFAVQETDPPYALSVIGLGPDALMLAEKKVRYALEAWREARARGEWIGYPRRTCYAALPMAHEAWWLEKEMR